MVILLGKVSQHDVGRSSIMFAGEEFRDSFVGQVTDATHDPLFYRPGIGTAAQHFQIVIGLHHQHVAATQVVDHADRHVAKVRHDNLRGCDALVMESNHEHV